jgi:hypothetical protein
LFERRTGNDHDVDRFTAREPCLNRCRADSHRRGFGDEMVASGAFEFRDEHEVRRRERSGRHHFNLVGTCSASRQEDDGDDGGDRR